VNNKRCYKQFCGLAKAMDIIGERWTLLILRDLILGPWRYSDLLERMQGMTTNLLARRLKELEEHGLIIKREQSSLGSTHVYELTELGKELEPAMLALSRFGFNFMQSGPEPDEQVDPGRALLNLKSRFLDRKTTHKVTPGVVTFSFKEQDSQNRRQVYQVEFNSAGVEIRHGENRLIEVCVGLSLATYADMVFRNADASKLEKKGQLTITGDRKIWNNFASVFSLKK